MWAEAATLGIEGQLFDSRRGLVGYLHHIFNAIFPYDFPRVGGHYQKPFAEIERERLGGYLDRSGIALSTEEQKGQTTAA